MSQTHSYRELTDTEWVMVNAALAVFQHDTNYRALHTKLCSQYLPQSVILTANKPMKKNVMTPSRNRTPKQVSEEAKFVEEARKLEGKVRVSLERESWRREQEIERMIEAKVALALRVLNR